MTSLLPAFSRRLLVLAAIPFSIAALAQPAAPAGPASAPPAAQRGASAPPPPHGPASAAPHGPAAGPRPPMDGASAPRPPMDGGASAPRPPHAGPDGHPHPGPGGAAGRQGAQAAPAGPQDAAFEGKVAAYLLSPEAEPAGLLFDDGREVRVPPHQGAALAAFVKPGQRVRVGARDADAPGPRDHRSLTSVDTGKTLVDAPPAGSPTPPTDAGARRPERTPLQPLKVTGTIRQTLQGPRGETRGVVLADGTQVSFPPHVATQAAAWITPGSGLNVEGYGRTSSYGTAVQATLIGAPGGASVQVYGPPAPR